MPATDPLYDEEIYEAMGMIDTRKWATRLRIVAIIRSEQRRSPDGIARISNLQLSRRAHCTSAYCWKLMGTGKSAKGLMWRNEHIIELVKKGKGRRPGWWRVYPPGTWLSVPWIEEQREARRLRLIDVRYDMDRQQALEDDSSRPDGAGQDSETPRSYGAALDEVAPRWRTRRFVRPGTTPSQRGTSPQNPAPPPLSVVADVPSAPPQRKRQKEEESSFAKSVQAAVLAKTGGITFGRIDAEIRRLEEEGVDVEWLVRAIASAPSDLKIPKIFDKWIPFVRDNGIPEPKSSGPVGIQAFMQPEQECPECRGRRMVIDDDGFARRCPVCCPTPVAE